MTPSQDGDRPPGRTADVDTADSIVALLASVARELSREPDVQHTLQRVVDLTARYLGPHVWASVSLVRRRGVVDTPAYSDERALHADRLQYELQDGPCLGAIRDQETVLIRDFATEERHRRWCRQVTADTGALSSLAFQLYVDDDSLGALNLYSTDVDGFDAESRERGWVFAAQASVALQGAQAEQTLRGGLATRNIIGQAMGMLMERHRISSSRAFELLRRTSQQRNAKLYDVALSVIADREPGAPPAA